MDLPRPGMLPNPAFSPEWYATWGDSVRAFWRSAVDQAPAEWDAATPFAARLLERATAVENGEGQVLLQWRRRIPPDPSTPAFKRDKLFEIWHEGATAIANAVGFERLGTSELALGLAPSMQGRGERPPEEMARDGFQQAVAEGLAFARAEIDLFDPPFSHSDNRVHAAIGWHCLARTADAAKPASEHEAFIFGFTTGYWVGRFPPEPALATVLSQLE